MSGEDGVIAVLRDAGIPPPIVARVEARVLEGRMTYGAWKEDGRDWVAEAEEEILDALAYVAAARHYQHAGSLAALGVLAQLEGALDRLAQMRRPRVRS